MAEIIGMGMAEAKDCKWMKRGKFSGEERTGDNSGILEEVRKMNHRQRYRAARRDAYMHSAQERFWLLK